MKSKSWPLFLICCAGFGLSSHFSRNREGKNGTTAATTKNESVPYDNPTSIIQPYNGPDPGYIIAESDTGLSNRLRVMAAYMWIAQSKFEGAHLAFIWDINAACPGHFLELFEPIPTVMFATNMSRYVLDKHAKIVYENSNAVFPWIMRMNNIPKLRFGQPTWAEIEQRMYSRYIPRRSVMAKVNAFVSSHHICQCSAMHIRTTDMQKALEQKHRRGVSFDAYMNFVQSRPITEVVYLLTDSPVTQQIFLNKFGPQKILVYSLIPNNTAPILPDPVFSNTITSINNSHIAQIPLPVDHRFTSLEHTLIDVLIAGHAKDFKGSPFSSLSELVKMFGDIGRKERHWCSGNSGNGVLS